MCAGVCFSSAVFCLCFTNTHDRRRYDRSRPPAALCRLQHCSHARVRQSYRRTSHKRGCSNYLNLRSEHGLAAKWTSTRGVVRMVVRVPHDQPHENGVIRCIRSPRRLSFPPAMTVSKLNIPTMAPQFSTAPKAIPCPFHFVIHSIAAGTPHVNELPSGDPDLKIHRSHDGRWHGDIPFPIRPSYML